MDDLLFQFTPLREGRPPASKNAIRMRKFQFTPLREGRLASQRLRSLTSTISIHAPPRGATRQQMDNIGFLCISIHAPPRGATRKRHHISLVHKHFNSRPSARGDVLAPQVILIFPISIHAPPRGATTLPQHTQKARGISIHAPPRGATPLRQRTGKPNGYFNSRPSARGDP